MGNGCARRQSSAPGRVLRSYETCPAHSSGVTARMQKFTTLAQKKQINAIVRNLPPEEPWWAQKEKINAHISNLPPDVVEWFPKSITFTPNFGFWGMQRLRRRSIISQPPSQQYPPSNLHCISLRIFRKCKVSLLSRSGFWRSKLNSQIIFLLTRKE